MEVVLRLERRKDVSEIVEVQVRADVLVGRFEDFPAVVFCDRWVAELLSDEHKRLFVDISSVSRTRLEYLLDVFSGLVKSISYFEDQLVNRVERSAPDFARYVDGLDSLRFGVPFFACADEVENRACFTVRIESEMAEESSDCRDLDPDSRVHKNTLELSRIQFVSCAYSDRVDMIQNCLCGNSTAVVECSCSCYFRDGACC